MERDRVERVLLGRIMVNYIKLNNMMWLGDLMTRTLDVQRLFQNYATR